MKLLKIGFIGLLMINIAFAESACKYFNGTFTLRCNNLYPNSIIMPGSSGSITIQCCFTGDYYLNNNETVPVIIQALSNHSYIRQNGTENTLITEDYPATQFIKSIDYPEEIAGFTDFNIVINYELPEHSFVFYPGAVLFSRVDVRVDAPIGFVPNIALMPKVVIPSSYKPFNTNLLLYLAGASILTGSLIFKMNQKMKKKRKGGEKI